jgi:hypothetical protein
MNERIKELVNQILPNEKEWHKGDPKDWGYFFSGNELEKFAELIVLECAKIADEGCGSACFGLGINGAMLLQHFGVEE